MARVSAFAQIEGNIDYSLVTGIPHIEKFSEIINHINVYKPTQEWYSIFKERIERILL